MPMVGILSSLVINLADLGDKHSSNRKRSGFFQLILHLFSNLAISVFVWPSILNLFLNCGM